MALAFFSDYTLEARHSEFEEVNGDSGIEHYHAPKSWSNSETPVEFCWEHQVVPTVTKLHHFSYVESKYKLYAERYLNAVLSETDLFEFSTNICSLPILIMQMKPHLE